MTPRSYLCEEANTENNGRISVTESIFCRRARQKAQVAGERVQTKLIVSGISWAAKEFICGVIPPAAGRRSVSKPPRGKPIWRDRSAVCRSVGVGKRTKRSLIQNMDADREISLRARRTEEIAKRAVKVIRYASVAYVRFALAGAKNQPSSGGANRKRVSTDRRR